MVVGDSVYFVNETGDSVFIVPCVIEEIDHNNIYISYTTYEPMIYTTKISKLFPTKGKALLQVAKLCK